MLQITIHDHDSISRRILKASQDTTLSAEVSTKANIFDPIIAFGNPFNQLKGPVIAPIINIKDFIIRKIFPKHVFQLGRNSCMRLS